MTSTPTDDAGSPGGSPHGLDTQLHITYLRFAAYSFVTVSAFIFQTAYFPLYFRDLGCSPLQIAVLSTAGTVATILGAPFALQLAYGWISAQRLFRWYLLIAVAFSLMLIAIDSFSALLACLFLCLFAKHGADALVDSAAVRASAEGRVRFEHVRVWGSVGFAAVNILVGTIVERFGTASSTVSNACNLAVLAAAGWWLTPLLRSQPEKLEAAVVPETGRPALQDRRLFVLLTLAAAALWGSHGPFYVYLSIYLRELKWDGNDIALAWNVGVVTEIIFFLVFPGLQRRFSLMQIYRISAVCTILRWSILAVTTEPLWILVSQALHAFSFAGCYLSSIKLIYEILPQGKRDRGYALYISLGPGVGSILGRITAGLSASLLESYRQLHLLFAGSAAVAVAALLLLAAINIPERTGTR